MTAAGLLALTGSSRTPTGADFADEPAGGDHGARVLAGPYRGATVGGELDAEPASTATGTGPAPDYLPTAGTVAFQPGETAKVVAVPIQDDPRDEPAQALGSGCRRPTAPRDP